MEKLYHVSNVPNLKVLQPYVSTHGKPYVYATKNLELALLFGSKKSKGDFDGIYGLNENGKPFFYEAYQGAFKRRFDKQDCFVYEVNPDSFKSNQTGFSGEVVSEKPVEVLNCKTINNLYQHLLNLVNEGKIIFKPFSQEKDYKNMIDQHIKNRLIKFDILSKKEHPIYKFCKEKFPDIINKLEKSKCG